MERCYFDHSATTPVHKEVAAAMLPVLTENFGNPSSIHDFGRKAKALVEEARDKTARLIGSKSEEIIFTSGGTEADNLAIIGAAQSHQDRGRHLITTCIEHHAVLDAFKFLESQGFEVDFLPVNHLGQVSPEQIKEALRDDTILVSIMHANNEVGTIQPIADIGRLTREKGVLFHTDAVQTVGKIPVDVTSLNADMLTLSGHKFYGPKGVGALYLRSGVKIKPQVHGGGQERKWRSGTENAPGIVGLGKAAELAAIEMPQLIHHLTDLGQYLTKKILDKIPDSILTGHPDNRIPGHVSFCFAGVEGESVLVRLDMEGIAVSSGSACTSGSTEPSHVLMALGLAREIAHGSLRVSMGRDNTTQNAERLIEVLPGIVKNLRAMSPFYNK